METPKTAYHLQTLRRSDSWLKHALWAVFALFASPGRMLIEVWIRKGFGERYFRISTAISTALFLAVLPQLSGLIKLLTLPWNLLIKGPEALNPLSGMMEMIAAKTGGPLGSGMNPATDPDALTRQMVSDTMRYMDHALWYLFLVLFLLVCLRHHRAMKQAPSTLDFSRYSLYTGDIHPFFLGFKVKGKQGDRRLIECLLEPLPFFLAGFALAQFGMMLGWLLMICAVIYALSYRRAYYLGDNFVLDKIDQMIINAEFAKTFLDDADESQTRRYHFIGRKPDDPEKRKAVFDRIVEDDEDVPLAR